MKLLRGGTIAPDFGVQGRIEVIRTLLGSFTSTYLPSGIFMHRSVTVRTIPQPFARETFSCAAKSTGLIDAVDRMT